MIIYLFDDGTALLDKTKVTPEYKTIIQVPGLNTGTVYIGGVKLKIENSMATAANEVFNKDKLEITVTCKVDKVMKTWKCEPLIRTSQYTFTVPDRDTHEVLIETKRTVDGLRREVRELRGIVNGMKQKFADKFVVGGTTE